MRLNSIFAGLACTVVLAVFTNSAFSQILYQQDFDIDDTANWTENLSPDTDSDADFFYDYSLMGIPSAPNSTGGTTRGIKMQANLFGNAFGGFSVSPTGQSFTGDYVLSYDMWQNYQGVTFVPANDPFPAGGGIIQGQASGTTNLSYGGIMSSGTFANSAGSSDSVFFAATGDGDSGSDFRVYSSDRDFSYQHPPQDATDAHATYLAGSRNNTAALYADNFGPEGTTAAQAALDPTGYTQDPDNVTSAGALGFAWRQHTITKSGDLVTWAVDGIDLITLDTANFVIPTGGNNILFGYGDVNNGVSSNANAATFLATIVDNVKVEVFVPPTGIAGDFNDNGAVDDADYALWLANLGSSFDLNGNGDETGGSAGVVDEADYALWKSQFGTTIGTVSGISTVPEPGCLFIALMAMASLAGLRVRAA